MMNHDNITFAIHEDQSCIRSSTHHRILLSVIPTVFLFQPCTDKAPFQIKFKGSTHKPPIEIRNEIRQLLSFRNAYTTIPFIIRELLSEDEKKGIVEVAHAIDKVIWPEWDEDRTILRQTFMTEQESGLFLLTSKDHNVRIFTPRHAQHFTVQYAIPIYDETVISRHSDVNPHRYIWIEQRWRLCDSPDCFRYAIMLMRRNLGYNVSIPVSSIAIYALPPSPSDLTMRTLSTKDLGVMPQRKIVIWQNDLLYRFSASDCMVIPDDSTVLLFGKDTTIFTVSEDEEGWCYRNNALPEIWHHPTSKQSYCIRAIKGEAERLKELNLGNNGVAANEGDNYGVKDILNDKKSVSIRSKITIPGTGCFALCSNGAVHVEYEDGGCVDLEGLGINNHLSNGRYVYTAHGSTEQGRVRNGICLGATKDETKIRVQAAIEFLVWSLSQTSYSASRGEVPRLNTHVRSTILRSERYLGKSWTPLPAVDVSLLSSQYTPPPSIAHNRSITSNFLADVDHILHDLATKHADIVSV